MVDDGVCDCCDGTDERAGKCSNRCKELGAASLQALVADVAAAEAGLKAKEGYIADAVGIKKGWRARVGELETEIALQQKAVDEAQGEGAAGGVADVIADVASLGSSGSRSGRGSSTGIGRNRSSGGGSSSGGHEARQLAAMVGVADVAPSRALQALVFLTPAGCFLLAAAVLGWRGRGRRRLRGLKTKLEEQKAKLDKEKRAADEAERKAKEAEEAAHQAAQAEQQTGLEPAEQGQQEGASGTEGDAAGTEDGQPTVSSTDGDVPGVEEADGKEESAEEIARRVAAQWIPGAGSQEDQESSGDDHQHQEDSDESSAEGTAFQEEGEEAAPEGPQEDPSHALEGTEEDEFPHHEEASRRHSLLGALGLFTMHWQGSGWSDRACLEGPVDDITQEEGPFNDEEPSSTEDDSAYDSPPASLPSKLEGLKAQLLPWAVKDFQTKGDVPAVPAAARSWGRKLIAKATGRPLPAEEGGTPAKPLSAVEQQLKEVNRKLNEARSKFYEVDGKLKNLKSEKKGLEEKLGREFGPQDEYVALADKCFEAQVDKYTYEVCPFGKASQKEGPSATSLGTWEGFGPNHSSFKFTKGQTCWQGPARSIEVALHCGDREELTHVEEPSRCEYHAELSTPAACHAQQVQGLKDLLAAKQRQLEGVEAGHDEL
ncbi:hypothetical protein N2152v2_008701 [Parachlorella kessleri]